MKTADGPVRFEGEIVAVSGDLVTRLTGMGNKLHWAVDDLSELRGALPTWRRGGLARFADALARAGLTIELVSSERSMMELGEVKTSLVGRMVFGSRHVRLRQPFAWLRFL